MIFRKIILKLSIVGLALLAPLHLLAQDVAQDFIGDIVLGRPTDRSITANVRSAVDQDIYLEFGTRSGDYSHTTESIEFEAGEPAEIDLTGLTSDTQYFYRLRFDQGEGRQAAQYLSSEEFSFHTARTPGNSFVFGVQGDSHPERGGFIPELYDVTLNQAKSDGLDFYFTTGDDFSIDMRYPAGVDRITEDNVIERYVIQRPYLGTVGSSAPVFLVNGNHEQGALYLYNDARRYAAPDNPAVWVQNARNNFFTQPHPNDFYSGNEDEIEYIEDGLKGSYYAFEWGDALFVTIDPFWTSEVHVDNLFEASLRNLNEGNQGGMNAGGMNAGGMNAGGMNAGNRGSLTENKWDITLGDAQYNWLKDTLENSDATFKFIFSHMLHGVFRGGVEGANLFEWGGEDLEGNYQFDTERPGWDKPLHQLMADTGVTVYFHAHDHIWVKQDLDGVVYQELPSPSALKQGENEPNWSRFYTDETSVIIENTGYTRVSVSPEQVQVDYVRTYLPEHENEEQQSGDVSYSYVINATSD